MRKYLSMRGIICYCLVDRLTIESLSADPLWWLSDDNHRTTVTISAIYLLISAHGRFCGKRGKSETWNYCGMCNCSTCADPLLNQPPFDLHCRQSSIALHDSLYYSWDTLKSSNSQTAGDAFMSGERNQLKGRSLSSSFSNILPVGYL